MPASMSRQLARFATRTSYTDLSPAVVDKVLAITLHAMASALAGYEHSTARRVLALFKAEEARAEGGSTVLVDGAKLTKAGAAYANGELIHRGGRLDLYQLLTHPSATVLPPALIAAEAERRSGRDFIAAVACGYEVLARMTGDWIPSTQARGFRSSPVYGLFGGAIAAGKLLDLTEDQMTSLIALCVDLAAGNLEGPRTGSHSVSVHEPSAARSAILAVLLARDGTKGSESALDGAAGFYHAYAGSNEGRLTYAFTGRRTARRAAATSALGRRWDMLNTAHRIYTVAGSQLPLIDVTAKLCSDYDIAPEDVDRVDVVMNWLERAYPSPAFPGRSAHERAEYYVAYGIIQRGYPLLRGRPDGGGKTANQDPPGLAEMIERIHIRPSKRRPLLAPRITIRTRAGDERVATATGREFMFDFAEEVRRISPISAALPIPAPRFATLIDAVRDLDDGSDPARLIQLSLVQP